MNAISTKELLLSAKPRFDEQKERLSIVSVGLGDIPQIIINDWFITSCSFIPALTLAEYLKIVCSILNAIILTVLSLRDIVNSFKLHNEFQSRVRCSVLFFLKLCLAAFSMYSAVNWSFNETPVIQVGPSTHLGVATKFQFSPKTIISLENAALKMKSGDHITFDFCCDSVLFKMPQLAQPLTDDECKLVRINLQGFFTPVSAAGEEMVHFEYQVLHLLINASHLQWWQPDEETRLAFELKISGIRRSQCRPELARKKLLNAQDQEIPRHAFPMDLAERRAMRAEVNEVLRAYQTACGTAAKMRLFFKQNSTGVVSLPKFPQLRKVVEFTPIGGRRLGLGTFFPDGFTICLKFSSIGRQPSFLNSFGHLSILHVGTVIQDYSKIGLKNSAELATWAN